MPVSETEGLYQNTVNGGLQASLLNWNLHSRQKNDLKIKLNSRPDSRDEMVLQIRTVKDAVPKKKYSFLKEILLPKRNTPLLSQDL